MWCALGGGGVNISIDHPGFEVRDSNTELKIQFLSQDFRTPFFFITSVTKVNILISK